MRWAGWCVLALGLTACQPGKQSVSWVLRTANTLPERVLFLDLRNNVTGKNLFSDSAPGMHSPRSSGIMDFGVSLRDSTQLAPGYLIRWQVGDQAIFAVDDVPVARLIPERTLERARGPQGLPLLIEFAFLPDGQLRFAWRACERRSCVDRYGTPPDGEQTFTGRLERRLNGQS